MWSVNQDNSQSWSGYPMERSNMWSIQIKTIQKFLQIHKKIKCHKQASRLLQPDQRQKQNHNRENLLVQQQPYRCTKEDGLTLSHSNKILLRTISLLRHNQTLQREQDGAIEFYTSKSFFTSTSLV